MNTRSLETYDLFLTLNNNHYYYYSLLHTEADDKEPRYEREKNKTVVYVQYVER